MILSDFFLRGLAKEGCFPEGLNIGPSSVDLTLANSFCWPEPDDGVICLKSPVAYKSVETHHFVLKPGKFVLASTQESIRVPEDMAAYVEGRSSIGRLGLQVQNASFIDGGFYGRITLELANQSDFPIILVPGIRICQVVYFKMTSAAEQPYSGKYNGQHDATPSRLFQDEEFSTKKCCEFWKKLL